MIIVHHHSSNRNYIIMQVFYEKFLLFSCLIMNKNFSGYEIISKQRTCFQEFTNFLGATRQRWEEERSAATHHQSESCWCPNGQRLPQTLDMATALSPRV